MRWPATRQADRIPRTAVGPARRPRCRRRRPGTFQRRPVTSPGRTPCGSHRLPVISCPIWHWATTRPEIDGRTSATNNQASWIGDGWDLNPGFIERTYGSCNDDKEGGTTPPRVGDLCWKSDNATASYNGTGGMLIHDTAKGVWRQKTDNGARIEHLTDAGNGAHDGEAWKITTLDGTQYFFGVTGRARTRPGPCRSSATTPANRATPARTFDASSCVQALAVEPRQGRRPARQHDDLHLRHRDRNCTARTSRTRPSSYVRGGTLNEIAIRAARQHRPRRRPAGSCSPPPTGVCPAALCT